MSQNFHVEKTITTDLLNPEDFIFSFQMNPINKNLVACSTSKNVINIYNVESNNLVSRLAGHSNTITEVIWTHYHPDVLFSSSLDNTVRGWDLRTGTNHFTFNGDYVEGASFFSTSCSGNILAGGNNAKIYFWDLSKNQNIFNYDGCHNGEVTQLKFHPNKTNKLFSGSDDGLLCTFDTSQSDENNALEQVYPIEDSISRIGIFGPSNEFLYCQTNFSNFNILSIETEEIIVAYKDLKNLMSSLSGITINYILECQYNPSTNQFFIIGATFSGSAYIFEIANGTIIPFGLLTEGHNTQIRALLWDFPSNKILTGAEDSKICLWSFNTTENNTSKLKKRRELPQKNDPY